LPTPILTTQNLSGGYGKRPGDRPIVGEASRNGNRPVLDDINLDLQPGEWLSILGANGSGKSTLLKLISRALTPQGGCVLLDGRAIHSQSAVAIAQQLALLPQQPIVPEGLTVRQLVSLGRSPHQPWWQWDLDGDDRAQIDRALSQTQLTDFADQPVEQLSGGERQRAFLALALAQNPRLLLLDEPTTYLDLRYQLELLDLLKELQGEGLAIVTVLHDLNLAARYSDRLALLRDGRLQGCGSVAETLTVEALRQVFDLEAIILDTPIGPQICPIAPSQPQSLTNGDLADQPPRRL
jgi:iron complex transport system ATP-binding protein